jgi:hypothetical protein
MGHHRLGTGRPAAHLGEICGQRYPRVGLRQYFTQLSMRVVGKMALFELRQLLSAWHQ